MIGAHVSLPTGLVGYVVASRGTAGGIEWAVETPGPVPTQKWTTADRLTLLPAPPLLPVGMRVRCYAQDCEIVGYDAENNTYALEATLTLPSGCIVRTHHYPAAPRHHIALWSGG